MNYHWYIQSIDWYSIYHSTIDIYYYWYIQYKKIRYIIFKNSPYFMWICLVFPQCPSSGSGSHSGCCVMLCYHVSLGSFWLWLVLTLPLVLITLTVLRSAGLRFCRMSLTWDLSILGWGIDFGEEDPQK